MPKGKLQWVASLSLILLLAAMLKASLAIEYSYFSIREGAAELATLYVSPSNITDPTLTVGRAFTVNVSVANIVGLYGFEFKLGYNKTILNATEVVIEPFLNKPTFVAKNVIDNNVGMIWLAISSYPPAEPKTGSGTLGTIKFQVVGMGNCVLDLFDTKLGDNTATPIPHEAIDGYFNNRGLAIALATGRKFYSPGGNIDLYCNLTRDGVNVQGGLVALQVNAPDNNTVIARTLRTPETPTTGWLMEIVSAYSCDFYGNPQDVFIKGIDVAYFNFTIRNTQPDPQQILNVTLTINAFDSRGISLGLVFVQGIPIVGNSSATVLFSFWIPDWASTGNATAYASAYSDFPHLSGFPYCPEMSDPFRIIEKSAVSLASPQEVSNDAPIGSESLGIYSLNFRLSTKAKPGTYNVYATSRHGEQTAFSNTIFKLQVTGDVNGDGVVDVFDLISVGIAFGSTPTDPNWNPYADLKSDDIIDVFDLIVVGINFGKTWT